MHVLRTPEDRFADLAGFPFDPRFATVSDPDGGTLSMHFIDEGPRDGPPILMCHGNPDWSYSFRGLIRRFADAGYRAIAPDMLGFGRSDKPTDPRAHSIERHVDWLRELVVGLDLRDATLVCQDWGSTMGCGVVALEPDRFARILVANGILHTAEPELAGRFPPGYSVHALDDRQVCVGNDMLAWLARSQRMPGLKASDSVSGLCREKAAPEVHAGYDAPFPDEDHMIALRQFAMLIPLHPEDEGAVLNRRTWRALAAFERPLLTVYGDSDPCTGGWEEIFQERVPGAKGQPHVVLEGAGHFLGEDRPDEFARHALQFVQST